MFLSINSDYFLKPTQNSWSSHHLIWRCKLRSWNNIVKYAKNRASRRKHIVVTTKMRRCAEFWTSCVRLPFFSHPSHQVRLQVLTAAIKMITAFWDVVARSLVEVDRRFRGAYCIIWAIVGGITHLWNVGLLEGDHTALYPRRLPSSPSEFPGRQPAVPSSAHCSVQLSLRGLWKSLYSSVAHLFRPLSSRCCHEHSYVPSSQWAHSQLFSQSLFTCKPPENVQLQL
jgi:hypothetical protein